MQRFGRAGHGPDTEAMAIYIVEPSYFDHAKKKIIGKRKRNGAKGERAQKRQRKEVAHEISGLGEPSVEVNKDDQGDSNKSSEEEGWTSIKKLMKCSY